MGRCMHMQANGECECRDVVKALDAAQAQVEGFQNDPIYSRFEQLTQERDKLKAIVEQTNERGETPVEEAERERNEAEMSEERGKVREAMLVARIEQLTPCESWEPKFVTMLQNWCDMHHEDSKATFGIEWCRKMLARIAELEQENKRLDSKAASEYHRGYEIGVQLGVRGAGKDRT